jgi:carboxyl-terminal processing protease
LVAGNIAYVRLYQFTKNASKGVLGSIKGLGPGVRGVVLDLRGNPGGDADQAARILGAFVHKQVIGVQVAGNGKRDPQRTDDRVALLHMPVSILIDQDSASSSEIVAATVRDYKLGHLVGERSAGALAGAQFYGLADGSGLEVTEAYILGPKGEKIDGIGVTPDSSVKTTAADLSAGHDPALDQAVRFVRSAPAA